MFKGSKIFDNHYKTYCEQIDKTDLALLKDKLGLEQDAGKISVCLFNKKYRISGQGMEDTSGSRPDYRICVILAKYILLCPDQPHYDPEWVSFKDFKKESHFTNVNFFASATEQAILKAFSGRMDALLTAGEKIGGAKLNIDMPYDLVIRFDALPRISLLLLMNDRDEDFPAHCSVLFQKHAEFYLDPESLAMTGALLANRLKGAQ